MRMYIKKMRLLKNGMRHQSGAKVEGDTYVRQIGLCVFLILFSKKIKMGRGVFR